MLYNDTSQLGLILLYLIIGMTLFSYFEKIRNSNNYTSWIFLGIIIVAIVYLVYTQFYKTDEDIELTNIPGEEPNDMEEKGNEYIDDFHEANEGNEDFNNFNLMTSKRFSMIDGIISKPKITTYESFKKWYTKPEFLHQYANAMKLALSLQRRKLLDIRNQQIENFKLIKSKNKTANIFSPLDKGEESKSIETIIETINGLLLELATKYKKISPDYALECLTSALTDKENGIDSMIGREEIKDFLALQIYTFSKNPRVFYSTFQNIAIYGSAGVGKTKLAKVIAHVYAKCGVLIRGNVFETTKKTFTTAYVNESARRTSNILMSNLSSVIFIDEAYDLGPQDLPYGKGIDHCSEAIAEIVNFLDKMMGLSLVIVAGYAELMETRFMTANEGLPRRFPNVIRLEDYNAKELAYILCKFLNSTCKDIHFSNTHRDYIYTILSHILAQKPDIFKNQAGDMLNLSGSISRSIYGTADKKWEKDSEELILSGINDFLASNNIMIRCA